MPKSVRRPNRPRFVQLAVFRGGETAPDPISDPKGRPKKLPPALYALDEVGDVWVYEMVAPETECNTWTRMPEMPTVEEDEEE